MVVSGVSAPVKGINRKCAEIFVLPPSVAIKTSCARRSLHRQHGAAAGIKPAADQPRERAVGRDGEQINSSAACDHVKKLSCALNGQPACDGIACGGGNCGQASGGGH